MLLLSYKNPCELINIQVDKSSTQLLDLYMLSTGFYYEVHKTLH